MKTIKSQDIDVNRNLSREISKQAYSPEFKETLITNHGVFPKEEYDSKFLRWLESKLTYQISPIYGVLNGDLSKKRILDLGCGSSRGTYESSEWDPKVWSPWLCRALLELGANPIGIDIGNLDGEKFENHRINLLSPNSLDFLEDNSIDVAHAGLLYDSPTLEQMRGYENLRKLLVPQLERVVKPEGFFIEGM